MQKGENSVLLSETTPKLIMLLPPCLPTKNFLEKLSRLSLIGILVFFFLCWIKFKSIQDTIFISQTRNWDLALCRWPQTCFSCFNSVFIQSTCSSLCVYPKQAISESTCLNQFLHSEHLMMTPIILPVTWAHLFSILPWLPLVFTLFTQSAVQ